MSYMPFARRYRPQRFEEVLGQEPAVQAIKNAIIHHKTAHAYLFSGTRGCGKTTLARILAKAINCSHLQGAEPCLTCDSCKQIATGNSLDIIEIDGASHRGIDDIRQIQETVNFQPSYGRFKVFMIDEVHMLTKEAFNALLKTLEEPPLSVKFIFATTEPHKIPATILSRCQKFYLKRISLVQIQRALETILIKEQILFEKEVLFELAKRAEGSLRDSLSLLDQLLSYESSKVTLSNLQMMLGLASYDILKKFEQGLQSQSSTIILELSEAIFTQGFEATSFLEQLQGHYRSILTLTCKASLNSINEDQLPFYKTCAQFYTEDNLLYILDFLAEALERSRTASDQKLHLEISLLHLVRHPWKHSLESILNRLVELEKKYHLSTGSSSSSLPSTGISNQSHQAAISTQKNVKTIDDQLPTVERLTSSLTQDPVEKKPLNSEESELKLPKSEILQKKSSEVPSIKPQESAVKKLEKISKSSLEKVALNETPVKQAVDLLPGRYDGLVQFAAKEFGGHLR